MADPNIDRTMIKLSQSYNTAMSITQSGVDALNNIIKELWLQENLEEGTDPERLLDARVLLVNTFGMEEVRSRLMFFGISIPSEFESYYTIIN